MQRDLDLQEYTDPEHNPMIPHTLVLKPGLVIHRIHNIYNGYWFWGRPSADAGQDGWGAAATASSTAVGALFLLIVAVGAALAYSNALFAAGVAAVVLVLLGGTTWLSDGFWAPDGAHSRFVSPIIGLVWVVFVSRVLLTQSAATRAGW